MKLNRNEPSSKEHSKCGLHRAGIGLLAVAALVLGTAGNSQAAMSRDQVGRMVANEFGVTVLKVEPMKSDDRAAFAVTVMTPAGDRNSALQVDTFVVDAETGKPVIQYGNVDGRQQWAAPPISHRTHPRLATDE